MSLYKKLLIPVLLLVAAFSACVKTEFDAPTPCDAPDNTVAANISIANLVAKHVTSGGYDVIGEDLIIKGTIVADDRSGNYYKALVLQDSTGGIEVNFNDGYLASAGFTIGRQISIKCKGLVLTDYRKLPQLQGGVVINGTGVPTYVGLTQSQRQTLIGRGQPCFDPPTPRSMTLNEALQLRNLNTLITLTDVQFNKADTAYAFCDVVAPNVYTVANRTLETCSGLQLVVRTSEFSNFATQRIPTGKGTATGILTVYNTTYQLIIHEASDLKMDGDRCPTGGGGGGGGNVVVNTLDETFSSSAVNEDISLTGWSNIGTVGTRVWRGAAFSGNTYAQATAFGTANPDATNTAWLITPGITVSTQKTLTFETSWSYWKHQGLTAWISTNYNGTDVNAATWTQLNCTIAQQSNGSGNFGDWVPSGNVALPVINNGKVHIGFKFEGDKTTNTTNWRVDNVKVQ